MICHDYPQLWDPSTPIAARRAEAEAAIAAYPPGTFAPFSAEAWTHTDYEGVLACLRWPAPRSTRSARPARRRVSRCPDARPERRPRHDHGHVRGAGGGAALPGSTFVGVANSVHVTALADWDLCASRIYARFVRTLTPGDTSCADEVGEWNLIPAFSSSVENVTPAARAAGDDSTRDDRRLAAAAALTSADVIARWMVNYDGTGVGLHGGHWSYSGLPQRPLPPDERSARARACS